MFATRRASHSLKSQGFSIKSSRAFFAKSDVTSCYIDNKGGSVDPPAKVHRPPSMQILYNTNHDIPKFFLGRCSFSVQAGTKSGGEEDDDSNDGFSELEDSPKANALKDRNVDDENVEELIPPELSEEDDDDDVDGGVEEPQDELELSDAETDATEKKSTRTRASSELFKAIISAPGLSVNSVLDKWVEQGKDVSRAGIYLAMLNLRKRRMFGRALQLSEWLESAKQLEFVERDYASRLDLIYKVRGLQKAESYIEKIPKSFRGEVIYRTLLANYVAEGNMKKSEEVFNKMKDLEFPVTSFACNQLLLLYKRLDKKKIADVLLLMEKENVKPSPFTYKVLIDTKGQSNDITGMDQILETMKAEGMEPDLFTLSIVARHYIAGGLKEKAEAVLKEMEGDSLQANRWACRLLLPLYANLGKADEVARVWKVCKSSPRIDECMAAIEAWGQLAKVEEAEAVFENMSKTWAKLSSKHYSTLLKVYANHKMLAKGKDLLKRMADSGCRIGPLTWDALVKLYVEAGEVEKADSILQKASQQNQMKPMFSSYMTIMDQYSRRGDIHNSEKMFHRMRQAGYVARLRQFQSLVQAYINAKAPAYGIRERMKADNVFPSKSLMGQLVKVDAFRKTAVSDLLD